MTARRFLIVATAGLLLAAACLVLSAVLRSALLAAAGAVAAVAEQPAGQPVSVARAGSAGAATRQAPETQSQVTRPKKFRTRPDGSVPAERLWVSKLTTFSEARNATR